MEFEPWLYEDAFTLLTISDRGRRAVRECLDAWKGLITAAFALQQPGRILRFLQLLDAAWGPSLEDPSWAVLGPLHPFRLDPVCRVAEHLRAAIGQRDEAHLGDAAAWLLDRCYPSYPAVYFGDRVLHLARIQGDLVFLAAAQEHLARADEGRGLSQAIKCLAGFCPYLTSGLTLLLIDPPPGAAIGAELSRLSREWPGPITVLVAATRSDANPLDEAAEDVRYIGRFASLKELVERTNTTAHVAVRFTPQPRGTVAAQHGWSATKGSFLAPHLEVHLDALSGHGLRPVAEVRVEPRESNAVVHLSHELYKRQTGSAPKHFQFRPMLPKEELDALKILANRADWLVIAAPGPMGIAAPARINSVLNYVGRESLGPYGLYVYSTDGLFSVRRFVERSLRSMPVAIDPASLADRLTVLARKSGAAILRMGRDRIAEHEAALVALECAARDSAAADYLDLILRVDDMGWTRIWIGEGLRCDFLLVRVAQRPDISPRIIIRAIESKSHEKPEPLLPAANVDKFREGIAQVSKTLAAISQVMSETTLASLDEDVRFATFIEHLMAALLASDPDFTDLGRVQRAVGTLNELSGRRLVQGEVVLEGFVCVTQPSTNAGRSEALVSTEDGVPVRLVRATAKDLSALFGVEGLPGRPEPAPDGPGAASGNVEEPEALPAPEAPTHTPTTPVADLGETEHRTEGSLAVSRPAEGPGTRGDDDWAGRVAQDLVLVCRRHQIPVADDGPSRVVLGPSLVGVSVRLKVGAQLSLIEKRLEDLMRDVGLGAWSKEVSVMNDAEPSTVRFLIPRPSREIPDLPSEKAPALAADGYLPIRIGRTLEGEEFFSPVEAWPHMLVAGTTGSGKTTFLRSLLRQFGVFGPSLVRVVLVDGKGEMDYLNLVPSSLFSAKFPEPVLGHDRIVEVLDWAVGEMEQRRKAIHRLAAKQSQPSGLKWPDIFREQVARGNAPDIMPLVILIDEFADLMQAGKAQAESFLSAVQRVAQIGRSRMVHLVLATQRPDKETIRGAIKTNLDARVVLRLPTAADSMTVLGRGGAERLLKHGDMIFEVGGRATRLQGYRA